MRNVENRAFNILMNPIRNSTKYKLSTNVVNVKISNGVKKRFPHITAFIFTLVLIFAASGFIFPETVLAHSCPAETIHASYTRGGDHVERCDPRDGPGIIEAVVAPFVNVATNVLLAPLGWVAILVLQLANLILWIAGTVLNAIVQFTIVDMSLNISRVGGIDTAWRAIRDIANMGFIFILLYAAIKTILGMGSETKKLVVSVIVVAILINFSLFFTKLVIDASNVLAVFFYDVLAPGALADADTGLSDMMMRPLGLTSLQNTIGFGGLLDGKKMIIIGVMGSIFVIIAAFVFFAIAIMFVIRFVVLIFVLILSPIAFMAFVLPALKPYGDKWKDALIGQAFFAPIYFMLTYIVVVVANGLFADPADAASQGTFSSAFVGQETDIGDGRVQGGNIGIVMNFIIMIALLITSLIIAKSWANKAGSIVAGINKWATGAAGGATFGTIGRGMRESIGGRAAAMADSDELKKKAAEGSIRARLQLAAANKASKSSFDVRGTALGGSLDAGKVKKGANFVDEQKERAKTYERYKPSPKAVKDAETKEIQAREKLLNARGDAREERNAYTQAIRRKNEVQNRMENMAKRIEKQNVLGISGILVSGKTKAAAIRAAAKSKSTDKQIADLVKKKQEEEAPETLPPTQAATDENKGEEAKAA